MTFDDSLLELYEDTITVEPFSGETSGRVRTYGTAVPYPANITGGSKVTDATSGQEVVSTARVMIPNRVAIVLRSRVTLPADFDPRQLRVINIEHYKGLGMDSTILHLNP